MIESSSAQKSSSLSRLISDLKSRICILCLTRSPLDPLMWAHYGESHKGFVVEYDVDDEFLTSSKYNLVPVQQGTVTYQDKDVLQNPPDFDYDDFHEAFLHACGIDDIEIKNHSQIIEYLYLTKSKLWRYEDEVRVVKLVDSIFEETHFFLNNPMRSYKILTHPLKRRLGCAVETQPGLKLFDKHKAKIVSIYFGEKNPLLSNHRKLKKEMSTWESQEFENIFKVELDASSWSLHPTRLNFP